MTKLETVLTDEWAANVLGIPTDQCAVSNFSDYQKERLSCVLTGARAILSKLSQQPKDVQGLEPVAWMWQHDETGNIGFTETSQLDVLEQLNPRLKIIGPLYTASQLSAAREEGRRRVLVSRDMNWNASR